MIYLHDLPLVQEHPDLKRTPGRMRRYWDSYRQGAKLAPETRMIRQREFDNYQTLTGILHRAGIPILAGTDAPEPFVTPGFSLHQELELLVASGLSPAAALQAATINNARIVNQGDKLGRIEPGMIADLVILRADPLTDIRRTRQIEHVVHDGQVVNPADILRSMPEE
jgi:imidazolonepropionase-like amidohydrolase